MNDPCPFCQIIRGREEAEDYVTLGHIGFPEAATLIPINPIVSGHRLFIPTSHVEDVAHHPHTSGKLFLAIASWLHERKNPSSFNLITSAGVEATQSVFHLHVHYLPRVNGDGFSLPWPSSP